MKVVCISKKGDPWATSELEIGITYEVLSEANDDSGLAYYSIKTKRGEQSWIHSDNFITLEESRDNKITNILT